ncbi:NUDIX domain-containing protein, partial [Chloroflexota bacterium]
MDDKPVVTIFDGYVKWLREQVGSQLIYLVYGVAVIFDEQGRVLVQSRYDFDWLSVPGGVMELGESLAETARREVYEETGIQAEIKGLVGIVTDPQYNLLYPNGDKVQQWTAVFWGEAVGGSLLPDGGETLDTFFIESAEFLQNTHPCNREYLRLAQHVHAGNPPLLEP